MNNIDDFIKICENSWSLSRSQVLQILNLQTHNKSVRINTLKINKSTLKDLASNGVQLTKLNWADNCYEVNAGYHQLKASKLIADGNILLQDSSSFLPVIALNPKPLDAILDLCAAPGGKTSHIASITNNKANIYANDSSKARFFKMKKYLEVLNVKADLTIYDGRYIGKHFNNIIFDKILLDAPCSGEANIDIKNPKSYANWSIAKTKRLSRLQNKLLITAYDLLKPGGTLVYSTCTINPDENEGVVNNLLKKRQATIEPIKIKISHTVTPVLNYNGKIFNKSITNTLRVLPSVNNEAFYVAKIAKPINQVEDEYNYYQ